MPILNVAFEAEARSTWLAALHQLALVDGDFDPEEQRQLAEQLNDDCPLQDFDWKHWRAPDLDEISRLFSSDPNSGEQFLRSAVVVALADGHLSQSELDLLQNWAEALGLKSELISSLVPCSTRVTQPWKPLDPLKHWLDGLDPGDERIASFIVHLIPAQCPFERDIILLVASWSTFHRSARSTPCTSSLWRCAFVALAILQWMSNYGSVVAIRLRYDQTNLPNPSVGLGWWHRRRCRCTPGCSVWSHHASADAWSLARGNGQHGWSVLS